MIKRLKNSSDQRNKDMVESINKKLNKMRKMIKNVPKDKYLGLKRMKK